MSKDSPETYHTTAETQRMDLAAASRGATSRAIEAIAGLRNVATTVSTTSEALDVLQQLELLDDEIQKARHACYGWLDANTARVSA